MRLDSVQHVLENIGYIRLSAFYSQPNRAQGEIIQKVARVVVVIFALLCVHDFLFHSLPLTIKWIIQGTLLSLMSCVSLSIILKSMQKEKDSPESSPKNVPLQEPIKPKEHSPETHKADFSLRTPRRNENSTPLPFTRVKRNLMEDFARADQENERLNG